MFKLKVVSSPTPPDSSRREDRIGLIKLVREVIGCSLRTGKEFLDGEAEILVNGQELETITSYGRASVAYRIEVVREVDPFAAEIAGLELRLEQASRDLDFLNRRRAALLRGSHS